MPAFVAISIDHLGSINAQSGTDLPYVDIFRYTVSKKAHLLLSLAISAEES